MSDFIISTAEIRIIGGVYKPCDQCRWYSVCIVPRGQCIQNINLDASRSVYQCEEFTSRKPAGTA